VLGSSVPGTISIGSKRCSYSQAHGLAGDRTVTLQCPSKTRLRTTGDRAGGVSGRAGASARRITSSAISRVATVKGIPVVGKASLFAGRRRNEDLGRSVFSRGFLPRGQRAGDSGCPEDAEEGNAVAHTP